MFTIYDKDSIKRYSRKYELAMLEVTYQVVLFDCTYKNIVRFHPES